eukprot:m.621473 g.621473  ORF g.621473 m.621473 type:complete len:169 (+) comp58215_c0_seq21:2139-2645(+)
MTTVATIPDQPTATTLATTLAPQSSSANASAALSSSAASSSTASPRIALSNVKYLIFGTLILQGNVYVHIRGRYALHFLAGVLMRAVEVQRTALDVDVLIVCGQGSIHHPGNCTDSNGDCSLRIAVPTFLEVLDDLAKLESVSQLAFHDFSLIEIRMRCCGTGGGGAA